MDEGDQPCSAPPVQRNVHPDCSSNDLTSRSHNSSSDLPSYSSTSSKVSMNKDFLKKSSDAGALLVSIKKVNNQHHRRSSITFNNALDPEAGDEKLNCPKIDKNKKSNLRKSHKNFNSISLTKARESKSTAQFKKVKSSYRNLFRSKKPSRASRQRFVTNIKKSPMRKKNKIEPVHAENNRRKTIMFQNRPAIENYQETTILTQ